MKVESEMDSIVGQGYTLLSTYTSPAAAACPSSHPLFNTFVGWYLSLFCLALRASFASTTESVYASS